MNKCIILFTIILMDLLTGMEFDLFVPAFPLLKSQFDLTTYQVEALLSVNFLAYCISLFQVGSLADRYGRKPLLIAGTSIFILGSVLCVFAPFYWCLLLGRFLQGIGIAAPSILSFLIVADSYPLQAQQKVLALLNGVMNIAVALAPVLGSYITLYFHWRGNFSVLLALGVFVLFMTIIFVPESEKTIEKNDKSTSYKNIIKNPLLMLLMIHIILMIVPYWIFVGMSPLLYIQDLGVSLQYFGYYQGILAFIFALGSFVFGLILQNMQQKTWLKASAFIFLCSLITLSLTVFSHTKNPLLITLALLPFIIGQIAPSTILYPLCLQYLPEAKGQISAIIQGGRLIFCAIALQIAGYFYTGSFYSIGIMLIAVIILVFLTLLRVIRDI